MIYYVNKLPMKPISCIEFHHLIQKFHSVDFLKTNLSFLENGWVIQRKDFVAYHFEENCIYDYIYNEKTHEVYISIDQKNDELPIDFLSYLIENEYLEKDIDLVIQKTAHYIDKKECPKCSALPIVYIQVNLNESDMNHLANRLKGLAHVVYGNEDFQNSMIVENYSNHKNYIQLFHNEYLFFSKSKKENIQEFIEKIYYKVYSYMTKRVFNDSFNMKVLFKEALIQLIEESKMNEEGLLNTYDIELSRLNSKKENTLNRIEQLSNQINQLEYQIDYLENIVNNQTEYPLLYKGKEKELYDGEQKDMILYLIQEELKTEKDQDKILLYQSILEENPKQGTRDQLFEEITRILMSCKDVNEKARNDLRKVGICLEKKQKHLDGCFFNDQRYLITMSSTTSDINANRQVIRMIRKVFF